MGITIVSRAGTPSARTGGAILRDGRYVADTHRCVHCSAHWEWVPGSGTVRGWCPSCQGFLCGNPECMAGCLPLDERLKTMEDGITVQEGLERYGGRTRYG